MVERMIVAIVGADSRAWRKIQDGEEKARASIVSILSKYGEPYLKNDPEDVFGLDYSNVTLISGHCPVGEERWYCVDCKGWLTEAEESLLEMDSMGFINEHDACYPEHRAIRVYKDGGVDSWAEIVATELGLKKEIYPAVCTSNKGNTYEMCKGHANSDHFWYYHFKPRNIQIAEAGLMKTLRGETVISGPRFIEPYVLYDIEPAGSCRYCGGEGVIISDKLAGAHECTKCEGDGAYSGGTWTLKYARKLGREVHKIVIR